MPGPPAKCDCGECQRCKKREYDKRRREQYPGVATARKKAYYAANIEEMRARNRSYYAANREQRRIEDRKRHALRTPEQRAAERDRLRQADPEKYRAQICARSTKWRKNHPEADRAQKKLRRAVAAGKVEKKPCEVCGVAAEAHHDDYSKPLDVRWLCRRHHKAVHAAA